jgi:hypothetical protein
VAAATSAQFALQLDNAGMAGDLIVPVTFGVIIGTGIIYGLGAPPFARLLGVALPPATGLALVGASPWLWEMARLLNAHGATVRLITRDPSDDPLDLGVDPISVTGTEFERVLAENSLGEAIIASTDETYSALAMSTCIEALGHGKVHYLPTVAPEESVVVKTILERGRRTFGAHLTMDAVTRRLDNGATLVALGAVDWRELAEDGTVPLTCIVSITAKGTVQLAPSPEVLPDSDIVVGLKG